MTNEVKQYTARARYVDPESMQNYFTTGKYISSSTLQHSPTRVSFTKVGQAPRFSKDRPSDTTQSDFYVQNTKSSRATSFGYGDKQMTQPYVMKNARCHPGPNQYTPKASPGRLGPTLKGSMSSKQYFPNVQYVTPSVSKHQPGPGSYNIEKQPGRDSAKYTIASKGKLRYENYDTYQYPASSDYYPNANLFGGTRYQHIGIGYGSKHDLTSNFEKTPGPGSYQLPSKFDAINKKSPTFRRMLE